MTGAYGMGADNIIEAEVVTPTGDVLTASACQNEDIFWATRGGGGGTFGVILSVTVKAYPIPSMELSGFDISPKNDTATKDWWRLIARFHQELPKLQDSGVHGYYTMSSPRTFSGSFFLFDARNGTIEELMLPLEEMLNSKNDTASAKFTNTWIPSWWDLVQNMPAIENIGTERSIRSSRFIPRRAVEQDLDLLAETLERIGPKDTAPRVSTPSPFIFIGQPLKQANIQNGVSNPSISGTMIGSTKPVDNALNPAWRDSIVHIITSQSWNDSLPEQTADETRREMTHGKGYALRQLAPDTGAYYNEVCAILYLFTTLQKNILTGNVTGKPIRI